MKNSVHFIHRPFGLMTSVLKCLVGPQVVAEYFSALNFFSSYGVYFLTFDFDLYLH